MARQRDILTTPTGTRYEHQWNKIEVMTMQNKIMIKSAKEYEAIHEELTRKRDVFLVEIDGCACKKRTDFFEIVSRCFHFPIPSKYFCGYEDWIRDLSWIEEPEIVLTILNYDQFLQEDKEGKCGVVMGFTDLVLPWWDTEVQFYVVEGKPRPFNVYLVTDFKKPW